MVTANNTISIMLITGHHSLVYPLARTTSGGLSFCFGILRGPLLGSLVLILRMSFKASFSSGH